MKKILLLLVVLLMGVNFASAQTSIVKTWVLQNPELAVNYTVVTFYANGQMLFQTSNLLNKENSSAKFSWKLDEKKQIITVTAEDGKSFPLKIMTTDNTLTFVDNTTGDVTDCFAVKGSSLDYYMTRVQFAIDTYGTDASLRKNGMASSSRESGYSFMPRYSYCTGCAGLGRCTFCSGSGRTTYNFRDYVACPSCRGAGTCFLCGGKGKIKNY